MGPQSLTEHLMASGLDTVVMTRYTLIGDYVVLFYDWIISLDQEVALIHPAPWTAVKTAYLVCRYYPMAIAPFHLWGLVGDHEQHVCESSYLALFACAVPTLLSAQFILMLRTYAFSWRKKWVLVVLSITYFVLIGVMIWVICKKLTLAPIFLILERGGCFAISDEPSITAILASVLQGASAAPVPIAYHMGIISILATLFDCLNMLAVVWHCVRERGTLGTLGKSILKQGIMFYVAMTALNVLTIGTFFSSYLVVHGLGSSFAFAYTLPSALSCRLVLMLRRKASPTETKLRVEHSLMVDDALEMIAVEQHPEEGFTPSISTDAQA
ncbi:hypothetical protein EDB92DRAFT_1557223 [Lactarius akahatsu]|uniref:DUF6533 domain-containing protein n=1 Tax=Lactarius akahatsu TaxID=416441 RepID=A0AAD4L7T3_9AGAM|nr:hypothetical protein EDB92DRAFT_1557223 [Lactarius akahatsu]